MSTQITTEQIKELRDATGISVMQCKNALTEAEGDMKKALAILKKNSSSVALKKESREVKSGKISIQNTGEKAIMLALLCETDFVAKNEDFIELLANLTEKAKNEGVEKIKEGAKEMIDPVIQKTGENIQLGPIYEVEGNVLGNYLHNDKIGVVVSLTGGNTDLAKDIAMHVAAMKPEYITEEDIDEEAKKTIREVFEKEISSVNKPEEIKKKMLEGKISTYFKEKTLVNQSFIKNADETVGKLLQNAGAKIKEVKFCAI